MLYVMANSNVSKQLGNRPFKTIIAKAKINFGGKDIVFFGIDEDVKKLNLFGENQEGNEDAKENIEIGGSF